MEQENKFVDAYDKMEEWLSQPTLHSGLRRELTALEQRLEKDSGDREAREEITHRFYKDLDFGTGGLRGILGAGTNRMNIYTVRRVTQGLADYFAARYGRNEKKHAIAIAFDSRIQSNQFALEAGSVLAANGFQVYIYPELMPTPALSFAVRYYNCCGGIMITASHNPAEYNGYKVYNEEGCQVNPDEAAEITKFINQVDCFNGVKKLDVSWETLEDEIILIPQETVEAYIQAVKKTRVGIPCTDIEVVFTPLNGSGNKPVRRILKEIGVDKIHVVPEQENPDGNFPTCPYPNPEKEEALLKSLILCQELETPDLLLATDPDCDRLGIALRKVDPETGEVSYQRMTGNQVGILLLDFICACRQLPDRPIAMKTIVSSKMADNVAAYYGVEMINVLTGFKFIGEQIGILEAKGEEDRFIFGFEESYGYLSGSYVRDKDGVNAAMLVCEAAAYYKKKGKSLFDRMEELHAQFGYYISDLIDFTFQGASGMEKMANIMRKLRENPPVVIGSKKVLKTVDYETSQNIIGLPKSDVMEYNLENESNIIIRPSGTEPKIKIYYLAKANTMEETQAIIDEMKTATKEWF